eukprot:443202-Hanusia_phi.AAC.1
MGGGCTGQRGGHEENGRKGKTSVAMQTRGSILNLLLSSSFLPHSSLPSLPPHPPLPAQERAGRTGNLALGGSEEGGRVDGESSVSCCWPDAAGKKYYEAMKDDKWRFGETPEFTSEVRAGGRKRVRLAGRHQLEGRFESPMPW